MSTTRNTFGEQSDSYASSRPRYPSTLYGWLAERCDQRRRAWDCATGNGQAAVGLAKHFERVDATDISAEQIEHSIDAANVEYEVRSAEDSGFPAGCFDLIAVAQALHWFDFARFWKEVERVGKPGAFFCAWGYAWMQTVPEVERGLIEPFKEIVGPFWAPNNRILWDGYRTEDVAFPFERVTTPPFAIEVEWSAEQLLSYMQTWSAYKRSREDAKARSAMDELLAGSRTVVEPGRRLRIRMPLAMIAGRVEPR